MIVIAKKVCLDCFVRVESRRRSCSVLFSPPLIQYRPNCSAPAVPGAFDMVVRKSVNPCRFERITELLAMYPKYCGPL